jgi:hypothetical protein
MIITSKEIGENYPLSIADAADYASRTIASRAFYHTVFNAVKRRLPLSVVRMGDGERQLFIDCATAAANKVSGLPVDSFDQKWRQRMGIDGLTFDQLEQYMIAALTGTQYFGPNVNGLMKPDYSVYPWYKMHGQNQPLVDNFFVNEWDLDMRTALLKAAGNVLVLHANPVTATTFAKRARAYLDVGIRHISIKSWHDAANAVVESAKWDYPLALVSVGPSSKYVIPEIAAQGKVVLDLGNAMDHWLLYELWKADPSKMGVQK